MPDGEALSPTPRPPLHREAPFFSELSDRDGPVACARMILSFFEPDEHFPVGDVSEMIFARQGRWVFEAQLIPILEKKGYRAVLHASTPYHLFAKGVEGKAIELFASRYGPGAKEMIDPEALAWAARHLTGKNFKPEGAHLNEALSWFGEGEMVMLSVSRAVLRGDASLPYCPCNLILTGIEGSGLCFHDPAQGPNHRASVDLVKRAFEAPGTDRAVLRVGR